MKTETMGILSRRDFLKGSLATAGLTLAVSISPLGYRIVSAASAAESGVDFKPSVWFSVSPDGRVTINVGNSEMGQGVRTAFAMIVSDELEADWAFIQAVQAPADDAFKNPLLGSQITVGSGSVRGFYDALRAAGAAGRSMLVTAAAQTWYPVPG